MSELDHIWIEVDGIPQVGFLTRQSYDNYPFPNAFITRESIEELEAVIQDRIRRESIMESSQSETSDR